MCVCVSCECVLKLLDECGVSIVCCVACVEECGSGRNRNRRGVSSSSTLAYVCANVSRVRRVSCGGVELDMG